MVQGPIKTLACHNCGKMFLVDSPSTRHRHWGEDSVPKFPDLSVLQRLPGPAIAEPATTESGTSGTSTGSSAPCVALGFPKRRRGSMLSSTGSPIHVTRSDSAECLCGELNCLADCLPIAPPPSPMVEHEDLSERPKSGIFCSPECGWSHHVRGKDLYRRRQMEAASPDHS